MKRLTIFMQCLLELVHLFLVECICVRDFGFDACELIEEVRNVYYMQLSKVSKRGAVFTI